MAAIVIVIVVGGTALAIVGLWLSSTGQGERSSRMIAVTAASLRSGDFRSTNAGITFICGSAAGSFLTLANTGVARSSVTTATISWAGQTNSYSLATGSTCIVDLGSPTGTQNLLFANAKLLTSATSGGDFSGTVTLSNGLILIFTGTFQ